MAKRPELAFVLLVAFAWIDRHEQPGALLSAILCQLLQGMISASRLLSKLFMLLLRWLSAASIEILELCVGNDLPRGLEVLDEERQTKVVVHKIDEHRIRLKLRAKLLEQRSFLKGRIARNAEVQDFDPRRATEAAIKLIFQYCAKILSNGFDSHPNANESFKARCAVVPTGFSKGRSGLRSPCEFSFPPEHVGSELRTRA